MGLRINQGQVYRLALYVDLHEGGVREYFQSMTSGSKSWNRYTAKGHLVAHQHRGDIISDRNVRHRDVGAAGRIRLSTSKAGAFESAPTSAEP